MSNTKGSTVRISEPLRKKAQEMAEMKNRSMAGQIEYWTMLRIITESKFSEVEINQLIKEYLKLSDNK